MKIISIILTFLIAFATANSQPLLPQNLPNATSPKWIQVPYLGVDSALIIKGFRDTTFKARYPTLVVRLQDTSLYFSKGNGGTWAKIGSGGSVTIDTSYSGLTTRLRLTLDSSILAAATNLKLAKADSTSGGYYPYSSNPKGYITSLGVINIYNSNGTLTSNRIVSGALNSIDFISIDTFKVKSNTSWFDTRLSSQSFYGDNGLKLGHADNDSTQPAMTFGASGNSNDTSNNSIGNYIIMGGKQNQLVIQDKNQQDQFYFNNFSGNYPYRYNEFTVNEPNSNNSNWSLKSYSKGDAELFMKNFNNNSTVFYNTNLNNGRHDTLATRYFVDSVVGGASFIPTLQQVTDVGHITTNSIELDKPSDSYGLTIINTDNSNQTVGIGNGSDSVGFIIVNDKTGTTNIDIQGSGSIKVKGNEVLTSVDTVSLSNRVNSRVKYTDTATMLSPYLRSALGVKYTDTSSMLSPYARTANLPSLTGYMKYTDSATMLTNYRNNISALITDTATLATRFGYKVNYTDTSSMLSPYLHKADTSTLSNRINLKLNISDTTAMLNDYMEYIDTVYLSNRINLKQNSGDSATYYTKYRSDTSRANIYLTLNGKLNKSDSTIYYPYASNPKNYLTSYTVDSTIWQTKYRSDTGRTNVYNALNTKGNGTVTSITLGRGITGSSPITSTGTIGLDTTQSYTFTGVDTFKSTAKTPLFTQYSTPTNNSKVDAITVRARLTTGTIADNFGSGIRFQTTDSTNAINNVGYIGATRISNNSNSTLNLYSLVGGAETNIASFGSSITFNRNATVNQMQLTGNLILAQVGNKISIATGSNASIGTATLSSGTVTVSTTAVTASSLIFLTLQNCSSCGTQYISAKTASTSFVISSTNILDGSIVGWLIIN